jgi:DNA polymerase III delta subunit
MITVLHGEKHIASRNELAKRVALAESQGFSVRRYDAKKLDRPLLESALGTNELFAPKTTVVIEELSSLPKSKKKDELISMISSAAVDVLLWERKLLTMTQLKPFAGAQIQAFKTSPGVFIWIDSLRPNNLVQMLDLLRKAVDQDGAEMCFIMLMRQIRLLLQAKDGGQLKIAPFMIGKVQKQASVFQIENLLSLHKELLAIDLAQKTSTMNLSLHDTLAHLMLRLNVSA